MFGRKRCLHIHLRCIHGDEVNSTMRGYFVIKTAVVRCSDCEKPIYYRVRPYICTVTNKPHSYLEMIGWLP